MRAGPLRQYVTVEALENEIDSDGALIETWVPAFDGQLLAAEISPLSGRELIAAQAIQSKVTTRIRIRYRPGVLPSMRVRHRSTVYNIDAVIADSETLNQYITLQCLSGVSDG